MRGTRISKQLWRFDEFPTRSSLARRGAFQTAAYPTTGPHHGGSQRRCLLTLAIETSCDDTCVAILDKQAHDSATLLFNKKVTSNNTDFRGIHPLVAVYSHTTVLAGLIREALHSLPAVEPAEKPGAGTLLVPGSDPDQPAVLRRKPNFISVTRGPGMVPCLSTGLNTAKGLAVAWQVPLLGVNHMQAHALTPQLLHALSPQSAPRPAFPFLTLLVSGGHTLLLHSLSPTTHKILAQASNIAVGDMLDKAGRDIHDMGPLPTNAKPPPEAPHPNPAPYAAQLEAFAFPAGPGSHAYAAPASRAAEIATYISRTPGATWTLDPPLRTSRAMKYDFSSLNGAVRTIWVGDEGMGTPEREPERRELARAVMKVAFEHLASRVVFALEGMRDAGRVKTLVMSGGVASNLFLRRVMREVLEVRGFGHVEVVVPPPEWCTDNAAMIAWTGMEMYEAGWRSDLGITARRKWPVDPQEEGGVEKWMGLARLSLVEET